MYRRRCWGALGTIIASIESNIGAKVPDVQFEIRDVLATGFNNDQFQGISCIRLFHHFDDSETRRRALRELRRICSGSIVVTFLNSFALDRYSSWLKAKIRRQKHDSQLPIPFKTFAADIDAAGSEDRQEDRRPLGYLVAVVFGAESRCVSNSSLLPLKKDRSVANHSRFASDDVARLLADNGIRDLESAFRVGESLDIEHEARATRHATRRVVKVDLKGSAGAKSVYIKRQWAP